MRLSALELTGYAHAMAVFAAQVLLRSHALETSLEAAFSAGLSSAAHQESLEALLSVVFVRMDQAAARALAASLVCAAWDLAFCCCLEHVCELVGKPSTPSLRLLVLRGLQFNCLSLKPGDEKCFSSSQIF
jgi:hypothetical protein